MANAMMVIHPYRQFNAEGWLCPALFKYFDEAPDTIYVRFEPKL